MKNATIFIVVSALFALSIWYFFFNKKDKLKDEEVLPPAPPAPAPPAPTAQQSQAASFVDSGEGLTAVNQRMKVIYNSADYADIYSDQLEKLYEGMSYKQGFKNAMKAIFGSLQKVPVIPSFISTSQSKLFKDVADVKDFEVQTKSNGFDSAASLWRQNTDIGGVSFWPEDLKDRIEAGDFGQTTKADKDRSERYNAFTSDFKRFAINAQKVSSDLTSAVKNRAIADLMAAGWKFSGY